MKNIVKFDLPESTIVNKFIAKKKFYENASLSTKIQNEFRNKIQKITWKHKLSENTIGISKTDSVTEIQIFEIELKQQLIPNNIIKVIDKTIPYQILYLFVYKNNIAYGITLKGDVLKNINPEKVNAESYYFSEWNEKLNFDFTAINLENTK